MSASEPPTTAIPGWRHLYSGKVRDLYLPDDGSRITGDGDHAPSGIVLMVASDRVSAYDYVLPTQIPGKGAILTALSRWWSAQFADLVQWQEVFGIDPWLAMPNGPDAGLAARSMVARQLDMVPVECVVRGYLTGSGLAEYSATGRVCGIALPPGLVDGDQLPAPIFTPARKAAVGDHDENVTFDDVAQDHGEALATRLRDLSIAIYSRAASIARSRGIILADTKFEFGFDPASGDLVLADEVLTPDSSRFWDANGYRPGGPQPSFDKQFIRDWLTSRSSGWDRDGISPPPPLPDDVVVATQGRYREALRRLTESESS